MTMSEVARWMVSEGISSANHSAMVGQSKQITKTGTNPAINSLRHPKNGENSNFLKIFVTT